jgi:hypothetical protein
MTAEEIIEIIEKEYSSCSNIISSEDRLYCYTWWKHDDCERLRVLLYNITNDFKYTLPKMRPEVSKAVEEMLSDPNINELMKKLGSDYDENGKAYWDK